VDIFNRTSDIKDPILLYFYTAINFRRDWPPAKHAPAWKRSLGAMYLHRRYGCLTGGSCTSKAPCSGYSLSIVL